MVSMAWSHLPSAPGYITLMHGGWALLSIAVKCQALLLGRMWLQSQKEGTATANWLQTWGLRERHHSPPHIALIPVQLDYLRQYVRDMAYIEPPDRTVATRKFKKRIYETLIVMAAAGKKTPVMRIVHKQPDVKWNRVWQNLHESRAPQEVRSAWYAVIHDILPTRERLAAINLTDTANCRQCNANDSLSHRLTDCGEGSAIWSWTKSKIAMMLRIDTKHVPISWTLHTNFHLWPPETTSGIMDTSPHGLVPDKRTTTPNHG